MSTMTEPSEVPRLFCKRVIIADVYGIWGKWGYQELIIREIGHVVMKLHHC